MKISRQDVSAALGDVTDALAARIIDTGANDAELAAAVYEVETNSGELRGTSPRVEELCRILSDGLDELALEDY
ncbi:MAG TPA: hypothetical protein VMZ28_02995 [Kofleriaceae bacterium]|nr:hypothetical protein [Kofleriaceae bacterium]